MEDDLDRLASSNVIAVMVTTTGGNILEANDAMLALLGYTRAELEADVVRWDTITPAEWLYTDARAIEQLAANGVAPAWEKEYLRRDGTRLPVLLGAALVRGRTDTTIVFCVDLTAQKATERELANRLERVREEQLAHVSRELHDGLGQDLTVLQVDAAWIVRRLGETAPDRAAVLSRAAEMGARIATLQESIRRIAAQLRPRILDDLGLVPAIEAHAHDVARRTGIAIELALPDENLAVSGDLATAVFRVYQELVTNVVRHARATKVEIALSATDREIELACIDNGVGIDGEAATGRRTASLGLLGIRERALMFGGTFTIGRGASGGTEAVMRLPREAGR